MGSNPRLRDPDDDAPRPLSRSDLQREIARIARHLSREDIQSLFALAVALLDAKRRPRERPRVKIPLKLLT